MKGFRHTTLGGIVHAMPPAIRTIIVVCIAVWFLQLLTWNRSETIQQAWIMLALWEPFPWVWQLVTYQFLHDPSGLMHVAFNMFFLWMFGRMLEQRWGSWAFLRYYLACGIGAGLLHWLLVVTMLPGHSGLVIGASGAVMGVFVAYGMTWPNQTVLFMFMIPMKAKHLVLLLAFVELLLSWQPSNGVANLAHLGGMLTGWLYLRHGWRLTRIPTVRGLRERFAGWKRSRKRSQFQVVGDREFDDWLERELDDETRH